MNDKNLMNLNIDNILQDDTSNQNDTSINNNDQWGYFLQQVKELNKEHPFRRRTYQIDEDVVDLFKIINIDNTPVVNLINAALRSFINRNKREIKQTLPKISLID